MAAITAIIGRILLGALFVFAGFGKVMDTAGTAAYMDKLFLDPRVQRPFDSAVF